MKAFGQYVSVAWIKIIGYSVYCESESYSTEIPGEFTSCLYVCCRSASPEKSQDKDGDERERNEDTTARDDADKAAEEEQKSRSPSPAKNDDENHTNDDDGEWN